MNKGGCLINNKQKQIFKAEGKTKGGAKSTVELKHVLTHNSSNTAAKQKTTWLGSGEKRGIKPIQKNL